MKKSIVLLIGIALILLGTLTRGNWIIGLKLLCAMFLIILILYWKIVPYRQQLFPKYQKAFDITKNINKITERLKLYSQNTIRAAFAARYVVDCGYYFYAYDISHFVKY